MLERLSLSPASPVRLLVPGNPALSCLTPLGAPVEARPWLPRASSPLLRRHLFVGRAKYSNVLCFGTHTPQLRPTTQTLSTRKWRCKLCGGSSS